MRQRVFQPTPAMDEKMFSFDACCATSTASGRKEEIMEGVHSGFDERANNGNKWERRQRKLDRR